MLDHTFCTYWWYLSTDARVLLQKMQVVQVMDPTLRWLPEDVGSSSSQMSGPAEGIADISETIEILHIDSRKSRDFTRLSCLPTL